MGSLRSHLRGEAGGVTLMELIVTIALSLLIGAAALMAIETTRSSSLKTTARQEAVEQAEHALQRMTREIQQATQAAVLTSQRTDMKTYVRNGSTGALSLRRVRFDCVSATQSCQRIDCGATSLSGSLVPESCTAGQTTTIIKGVLEAQFEGELNGVVQTSLPRETPNVDFMTVRLRVRLDDFTSGRESVTNLDPIEIKDGVEFANIEN